MTKRSFSDFRNQFSYDFIDNVKVPYNVLVKSFKSDVTTYDDIQKYFNIDIDSDGTNIVCNFINYEEDEYIYPTVPTQPFTIPNNLDFVKTYYYMSDKPDSHVIGCKLTKDNTSVIVKKPFADATIDYSFTGKLHVVPPVEMYYSSYNEYIILPKDNLDSDDVFKTFATDIYKQADDSTKTEYDFDYELYLFTPSTLLNINSNFKFGLNFDSSFLGCKNGNSFQQKPNNSFQPQHTNVTNNIIDSYYEYESEYKLNGQLLIDSDITSYNGPYNLNLDTTVLIINENYKINRAHVPPMRYLGIGDFDIVNTNNYQPTIAFGEKNKFRHVKIMHDNHSQFTEATSIESEVNSKKNLTKSEFLVEFSGYNEVVEL